MLCQEGMHSGIHSSGKLQLQIYAGIEDICRRIGEDTQVRDA